MKQFLAHAPQGLLLLGSIVVAVPAHALAYQFAADTSAFAGSPSQLAFDFIDGDAASNSVRLYGFSTDGVLGGDASFGDVSGQLPGQATLSDSDFFNEYLLDVTLGQSLSFLFETTANTPTAGSFFDAFSFFLLDPGTLLPLFPTSDATGANALFMLDIDGSQSGDLSVHRSDGQGVTWSVTPAGPVPVPEPGTLWLLAAGAGAVCFKRRRAGARAHA
ncbi:MAG: NF038129 family PEP-CTERM protein [Gammaproteobacteria bacterium]